MYYNTGESIDAVSSSPILENLGLKVWEALHMAELVDE